MHFEVVVGAVAKELRAARPEVDERREEVHGRRGRGLVQMDCSHAASVNLWRTSLRTPLPEGKDRSRPRATNRGCACHTQ